MRVGCITQSRTLAMEANTVAVGTYRTLTHRLVAATSRTPRRADMKALQQTKEGKPPTRIWNYMHKNQHV
jgi:hypothetical protein